MQQYILMHAQKSPSVPVLYLEPQDNIVLFALYSTHFDGGTKVSKTNFLNLWYKVLASKISDPSNH